MPTSPNAQIVVAYMHACNTGDIAVLEASFTEDVVAYFIDRAPVRGREVLAAFWAKVHRLTGAHWTCDCVVAEGDRVVVEWTERWTPKGADAAVQSRGVDLFEMREGRIAEIRQFHRPEALPWTQPFEMQDYPYAARGYPESFLR